LDQIPKRQGLKLIACSSQPFGKWTRHLITMEKISNSNSSHPQNIKNEKEGKENNENDKEDQDDDDESLLLLNRFRHVYFEKDSTKLSSQSSMNPHENDNKNLIDPSTKISINNTLR